MAGVLLTRRRVAPGDPRTNCGCGIYESQSEPELNESKRRKMHMGNMMTDPRIWRGNTYCMYRNQKLEAKKAEEEYYKKRLLKARPTNRDDYHRKMQKTKQAAIFENNPPVEGRKHGTVQTELFLQELSVRPAEADQANQTDEMLERPLSPVFIPAKTGLDMTTQILEGELFLFDVEVMPILECLNGKIIEQALLEVVQEEELADIRAQHRAFQTAKNFEKAEQQRLVDEQRRKREEKEMRKRERKELMRKEQELSEKLAAHAFAKTYLQSLVPNIFQRLHEDGMFSSPIKAELDIYMVPWLAGKVNAAIDVQMAVNSFIQELVGQALTENKQEREQLWTNIVDGTINTGPAAPPMPTMDTVPIITIEPSLDAVPTDTEESHDEA